MEAKLIKTGNEYLLKDLKGEVLAITSGSKKGRILSLKNCQAIENGYDLDELVEEAIVQLIDKSEQVGLFDIGFEKGFQKALEILGDKKFSEEQLRTAILFGEDNTDTESFDNLPNEDVDKCIQSLQQTEWNVWLVMACGLPDGCTEPEVTCTCDIIPSLDTDGCLILKRK